MEFFQVDHQGDVTPGNFIRFAKRFQNQFVVRIKLSAWDGTMQNASSLFWVLDDTNSRQRMSSE
jgi:hypothetical protein